MSAKDKEEIAQTFITKKCVKAIKRLFLKHFDRFIWCGNKLINIKKLFK